MKKIDAANINLNNGSKGAARVDDPAVGTDTEGLGAGTVNSTITSGSGSVKIGDSGNASDASALVLTEIPDEDVPVDERIKNQRIQVVRCWSGKCEQRVTLIGSH